MKTIPTVAAVAVLAVAAFVGVAYSGGCSSSANLVWTHPSAAPNPATHTYIGCSVSGANTATLRVAAGGLSTGDGCTYTADLANTGNINLNIAVTISSSTPHGAPAFGSCFGYTLSSGPSNGRINAGSYYPYTLSLGLLSSAANGCEGLTGSLTITFTGTSPCNSHGGSPGWGKYGPDVNLQGQNLSNLDFSGYNLAGDNLQGADLECDNFAGASLKGANLQNANLIYCNLTGAYLQGANGQNDQVDWTILTGANLQGANLQHADLEGAIVTGFSQEPTNFNGANLQGINLEDVSATGYITTVGANAQDPQNVGSCVSTSGSSTYCNEL